jgi:Flp pilus assembly protein TadD
VSVRIPSSSLAALLVAVLCGSLPARQDAPEPHLGRGYDALKQERYDEAASEFREALRLDPKLVMRARFPLAVALFDMKDTEGARREFETVRRESGDQPGVLYYLGRVDLLEQRYADAVVDLTKAMANPPFPDTAYHLGFACLKQGDLPAAEKWLTQAARANPADSAVPYQLGMVYRKAGRDEQAQKAFDLSTELRRRSTEESELKQECERKLDQGPREEAHAVCARLYDAGDAERLTALGTIYGRHGDLEAALEPLRRAAELAPQSPQMQYNLAFTYYELNRFEDARAPIARAVERWPDIFQLNALYGVVLLKLGSGKEAWPVLSRANALNPQDARTAELLYRTSLALAHSAMAAGEHAGALRYFEEAARLRPEEGEPRQGIAEARAAMGHPK